MKNNNGLICCIYDEVKAVSVMEDTNLINSWIAGGETVGLV